VPKRPQTNKPFGEALAEVLAERKMSQRGLAEAVGIEQSHLSRLARGVDSRKRPSVDLARRITKVLGLPNDYFRETREAVVIERLRTDSRLLNRIYRNLTKEP
jgi:transcriptional regulator with XRE-family HTH domain